MCGLGVRVVCVCTVHGAEAHISASLAAAAVVEEIASAAAAVAAVAGAAESDIGVAVLVRRAVQVTTKSNGTQP